MAKSKPSNITSMNDAACALSSCLNKALYFDYIYSGDRTLIGVYRVNDDVWFKLPTSAISEQECIIVKNVSKENSLRLLIHHKDANKCKLQSPQLHCYNLYRIALDWTGAVNLVKDIFINRECIEETDIFISGKETDFIVATTKIHNRFKSYF